PRRLRGTARARRGRPDAAHGGRRCRRGGGTVSVTPPARPPVSPRDDLALRAGYHSPQLDVAVRLNTNEAPEPPPAAFVDRLRAALGTVAWHRYPDRGYAELRAAIAAHHGVEPAQVFAANGSNEVLQTLLLTYGGPGRTAA